MDAQEVFISELDALFQKHGMYISGCCDGACHCGMSISDADDDFGKQQSSEVIEYFKVEHRENLEWKAKKNREASK
jgi:hypothetical protein